MKNLLWPYPKYGNKELAMKNRLHVHDRVEMGNLTDSELMVLWLRGMMK